MENKLPYAGPRPFDQNEKEIFFGREYEQSELFSMIVSNKVVLLYSQSGAGKTSLINASVLPRLVEEGFEVMPIVRAGRKLYSEEEMKSIKNIYCLNTILTCSQVQDSSYELYRNMSLKEYAKKKEYPRVIVFDQFEEVFSNFEERWSERKDFFIQLNEALQFDQLLRVVLVLREDFLARIEQYTTLLQDNLRCRFHLEKLKKNRALEALILPLKQYNIAFDKGVAEGIIDKLLKIRIQGESGETIEYMGEFVDPVQLQLTCINLWKGLPSETFIISRNHIRQSTNVENVLVSYYNDVIKSISTKFKIDELEIRNFFENSLITKINTRGTTYQTRNETAGISNTIIAELERFHLIHTESKLGARWLELTHDTFINPILNSNKKYQKELDLQYLKVLAKQIIEHLKTDSLSHQNISSAISYKFSDLNDGQQIDLLLEIGLILNHDGHHEDAIKIYNEIIDRNKACRNAFMFRGGAYWYNGNLDLAVEDFNVALELTKNHEFVHLHNIYHNRGQIFAELNDLSNAINDLRTAIKIEEQQLMEPSYARNGLAFALGKLDRFKESLMEFDISIDEHPNNAWVYFNRAIIFEKMGNLAFALDDYLTSLEKEDPALNIVKLKFAKERINYIQNIPNLM